MERIDVRPPGQIEPWLSTEDLHVWVRETADKAGYQRRLAICVGEWYYFLQT
jgi:hypothetical protein